jgi:hypothetical protein
MDSKLSKRLKSLAWRAFMMSFATAIAFIGENLNLLELSPGITVVLGLFLGEVSKFLNTKTQ